MFWWSLQIMQQHMTKVGFSDIVNADASIRHLHRDMRPCYIRLTDLWTALRSVKSHYVVVQGVLFPAYFGKMRLITMAWHKTELATLLTHWSYHNIVLSHRYICRSNLPVRQLLIKHEQSCEIYWFIYWLQWFCTSTTSQAIRICWRCRMDGFKHLFMSGHRQTRFIDKNCLWSTLRFSVIRINWDAPMYLQMRHSKSSLK